MANGMTSCDVTVWRHMVSHNEFVRLSIHIKHKRTFGQKDCTISETREVCERSGVFIGIIVGHHVTLMIFYSSRSEVKVEKDSFSDSVSYIIIGNQAINLYGGAWGERGAQV